VRYNPQKGLEVRADPAETPARHCADPARSETLKCQGLAEAADGSKSCEVTLKVTIDKIKRRRSFR
jgi:hypothetical protein